MRRFLQKPVAGLEAGETVLFRGPANHARSWLETVGGRLVLTYRRLLFEPHAFNVHRAPVQLPLASISAVVPAWTKVWGFQRVADNSVAVHTGGRRPQTFVVSHRTQWMDAIEQARHPKAAVAEATRLGALR